MNTPNSMAKTVGNEYLDQGHQAHFVGGGEAAFPYSAEELQRLAEKQVLSATDHKCLDEILSSLKAEGKLPYTWTPQEQYFIAHNDQDRLVPYLIYRFKFRVLPERHEVADLPVHLLIEPCSVCNLRCVMCFQTDKSFTRKPFMGQMDIGLYREIIDQAIEGGVGAISIGSRGEPLIHPKIGEMLRYASGRKTIFDLKLITNATKLGEAECHHILSSDVNLVALSIDAYDKATYEDIRVRGNFDTVLSNVRRLREIRDRDYPNSKVELRVSGVRVREDQNEEDFSAFWSKICDTTVMVRLSRRWNTYENPVDSTIVHPCAFLWNRLYIWHDGTCNPCDEDYKSMLTPGNVNEKTIREIWGGEAMKKMRSEHLNKNRGMFMPCDRCGV